MHYDVAVMNYPLFCREIAPNASARLLKPPYHTEPGGPWPVSLYIHVPFCDSLCDFCVYDRQLTLRKQAQIDAFVEALLKEIELYAQSPRFIDRKIDAIFVGGGTPTALSASQLDRILKRLARCFCLHESEITVECNPQNAGDEKLAVLKENGVTRVSTGIQSFDNRVRKKFNITVSGETAELWLKRLQNYRFGDTSVDLIYGFPGVEKDIFMEDLRRASALGMGHISVYKLAVFANTALYKRRRRGTSKSDDAYQDEVTLYAMFVEAHRFLLQSGYVLQSAQEYGKAGKRSAFWDATYDGFGDNLTMGTSGFGYVNGYCYQNESDVSKYIKLLNEKIIPVKRMSPQITSEQQRERAMVMGFRRGYVLREPFETAFGAPIEAFFDKNLLRLKDRGLVKEKGDRYILTERGLFYQGNVSADFMVSLFRGLSPLKKRMCIGNHEMP